MARSRNEILEGADCETLRNSKATNNSEFHLEAPAAFLLLCLFSMKFTVISNTYTSRDIRITRACMDSDEKTVHSSQCYSSYCSVIKFVTQSFCEFVTDARLLIAYLNSCSHARTIRSIARLNISLIHM